MLAASGLMVFYENMLAVNDIELRCGAGQISGLFGANAAGKTSVLHALSGILLDIEKKEAMRGGERITLAGSIRFDGEDITRLPPSQRARRGLVLCPERRRIFAESSVLENLKIGGHLAGRVRARATLELVCEIFPPLADRRLQRRAGGFLSGGEQQMLAIGRALMAQPRMLLLDEPLLGLSPRMQHNLVKAIVTIREQAGIAVLVAEQYARPILPIVDHGSIIENGSLVLAGTRDELLENADVQAAYFGVESGGGAAR